MDILHLVDRLEENEVVRERRVEEEPPGAVP